MSNTIESLRVMTEKQCPKTFNQREQEIWKAGYYEGSTMVMDSVFDLQSRLDYEIKRREAAELVIEMDESFNDSFITELDSYDKWEEIVNQQPKP